MLGEQAPRSDAAKPDHGLSLSGFHFRTGIDQEWDFKKQINFGIVPRSF